LDDKDEASDILAWVGKSRKLDEKRKAEEEKTLHLARALEEQVISALFYICTVLMYMFFTDLMF
jgi:hypothetical protein